MLSKPSGGTETNALIGIGLGSLLGFVLITFDIVFRKFNLRSFNIGILGLFFGYLMGEALVLILNAVLDISAISFVISPHILEMLKISLFLFGTYLGTIMTLKAADELYVSIPFVKFAASTQKKKDLIIDISVLSDARVIDLASTGILDHFLVIPRFLIKEIYTHSETGDEISKNRAKKCLDAIKKLENMEGLEVRFNDTDFPETKDTQGKLVRLARLLDANILSADISRLQMSSVEGIRIINLHTLSNALKPLTQTGEFVKIKIQRYGKEPRQGVGYLDDGTMVVVNGGGRHIGEIIDAQVLSVKHTTSGRMVFCNACDEEGSHDPFNEEPNDFE
ncbi:MAG: TRAM domain-containing protein [Chlamydiae bacterium]|nr:TRAM domain-containing protein [Chlamydiota bacterium]